jgi:hypothetical protein
MKTLKMKQTFGLVILGMFGTATLACAQTTAPSIDTEVSTSQQYVDSIVNSMGSISQSTYDFSADYKAIGPSIRTDISNGLANFRDFMGTLGLASGLSSAIKDYNDAYKAKGSPAQLTALGDVIYQQVSTAETLYQNALAALYEVQPNLVIKSLRGRGNDATIIFADQTEMAASALPDDLVRDKLMADEYSVFPNLTHSFSGGYGNYLAEFQAWMMTSIHNRYDEYLHQVCGSKYCMNNVIASWSHYYDYLNESVNRDLVITLADSQTVTVRGLHASEVWESTNSPLMTVVTTYKVGADFIGLDLKLTLWPKN